MSIKKKKGGMSGRTGEGSSIKVRGRGNPWDHPAKGKRREKGKGELRTPGEKTTEKDDTTTRRWRGGTTSESWEDDSGKVEKLNNGKPIVFCALVEGGTPIGPVRETGHNRPSCRGKKEQSPPELTRSGKGRGGGIRRRGGNKST